MAMEVTPMILVSCMIPKLEAFLLTPQRIKHVLPKVSLRCSYQVTFDSFKGQEIKYGFKEIHIHTDANQLTSVSIKLHARFKIILQGTPFKLNSIVSYICFMTFSYRPRHFIFIKKMNTISTSCTVCIVYFYFKVRLNVIY